MLSVLFSFFFFFNDTATTEIYTLSLHDALPILASEPLEFWQPRAGPPAIGVRSEEHTSELQSRSDLVCRLLLEKKTETERSTGSRTRAHSPTSLARCAHSS